MKKILFLMLIIFFVTNTQIFAECTHETQESTITTDATVNKNWAPDTAVLRFYVENSGLNVADIKAKNDKIVNLAIGKIKEKLSTNEQIKTISYSINNIYSYKDKIRIFQKYEVRNGFEVKLKDLTKVSEIIQIAVNSGVKEVNNINFTIENSEDICNQMMMEASQIAKTRAVKIANTLGASLLKPKSVNPYCSLSSSHRSVSNKAYLNSTQDSTTGATSYVESIEPGEMNVRANVNLIYYLK